MTHVSDITISDEVYDERIQRLMQEVLIPGFQPKERIQAYAGEQLRNYLEQNSISVEQFSEETGVKPSDIELAIEGDWQESTFSLLSVMAGIPMEQLLPLRKKLPQKRYAKLHDETFEQEPSAFDLTGRTEVYLNLIEYAFYAER